jgi:hypothetical protein
MTSSCPDGEGLGPVVAGAAPAPGDGRLKLLVGLLVGATLLPVGGAGELLSAAGDKAGVILSGRVACGPPRYQSPGNDAALNMLSSVEVIALLPLLLLVAGPGLCTLRFAV